MSFELIMFTCTLFTVLGYMLGRSDGKEEGNLEARAEFYKGKR
jgi:hypothetical protein